MAEANHEWLSHSMPNIKVTMTEGGASTVSVVGFTSKDRIISVSSIVTAVEATTYGFTAGVNADVTSLFSYSAAGVLACSSTTANKHLLVVWLQSHPSA